MPTLFTVGYGGRTPSELVDILTTNKIDWVVDVRARPGAYMAMLRAGDAMALLLRPRIRYKWLQRLGNFHKDLKGYHVYMETARGMEAINDLVARCEFVSATRVCLLCCERDPRKCHRTIVANTVANTLNKAAEAKWEITHL